MGLRLSINFVTGLDSLYSWFVLCVQLIYLMSKIDTSSKTVHSLIYLRVHEEAVFAWLNKPVLLALRGSSMETSVLQWWQRMVVPLESYIALTLRHISPLRLNINFVMYGSPWDLALTSVTYTWAVLMWLSCLVQCHTYVFSIHLCYSALYTHNNVLN